MVENKNKRSSIASVDADGAGAAAAARSQMRRRFDLVAEALPPPNVASRRTTRPRDADVTPISKRPTIPTPRPRISLSCIPRCNVNETEMRKLPLDQRSAFVLTHIDGTTNLRTLIDVTSMTPEEVVTTVERLLELKAISLV